jgi:recombination protein RecT
MSNADIANVNDHSNPVVEIRRGLQSMESQFKMALPAHIPVERFVRVVMTAIQGNYHLLKADRRALFSAAMKAAQDGLLADGREGALVPFGDEVTWIPMIAGLRKKVRNSGEIATWDIVAVYENDKFEFELGDTPFIKHAPTLKDQGVLIAVYSVATLKSGEKSRDIMGVNAVIRIRDRSAAYKLFKRGKIKSTPWQTDFDEMAKKTVARRHSKTLPMSSDLDDLLRRDDALYNYEEKSDAHQPETALQGISAKLDALAAGSSKFIDVDEETGEIIGEHTMHEIADVAEDKPDETKREKLIAAGQEAAQDGMAGFNAWWGARTDAERALVGSAVGLLIHGAKLRDM